MEVFILVLGIGRSGHIGFSEPGSREDSGTRLVRLDNMTRADAVLEFMNDENAPYRAISIGMKNLMKARKIYVLAWGQHKAHVLKEAIEGPVTAQIPASFLQNHSDIHFFMDEAATEELTRFKTPWLRECATGTMI